MAGSAAFDVICADNHNYFQFKLRSNGRSGAATQVVDVPVVQLHRCCPWFDGLSFFGPCTQVHGQGFPRHQGGEGVAGTPGACSQVFCHPIRCILGATLARHGAFFII